MGRSRSPSRMHFKLRATCWTSLSSAFVHWRLLKKFVVFSFYFTWDDFGFHTRWMISRKPSARKCVKLLSLFLFRAFARFGDSLPLHHSGHQKGGGAVYCCVQAWSPQVEGAFVSFTLSFADCWLPKWICQLGCAGRQVGEGGCWYRDQPRHIDVHYLLLILYSPLSYFVIWHLILDKWQFCWLLAQMYDFKVWLLWLFAPRLRSPRLAALSVVEIADALLVLLNLFDRACWTRPFVSACKEAGV